jgi:hypothetical protein
MAGLLAASLTTAAYGEATLHRREAMPFHRCVAMIKEMSESLGATPVSLLQTRDVRVMRIEATDGIVVVTCNRPDSLMIVARQPRPDQGS